MRKIFYLSIAILFLNSCGHLILKNVAKSYLKKHKTEYLPSDFFNDDKCLIVLLDDGSNIGERKYNEAVQKKVKKLYHGNYKFLKANELEGYDKDKYKYIFAHTGVEINRTRVDRTHDKVEIDAREFIIINRETEEVKMIKHHSSFYKRIIEAYFKTLEQWRIESKK